jgi:hypothetical protein
MVLPISAVTPLLQAQLDVAGKVSPCQVVALTLNAEQEVRGGTEVTGPYSDTAEADAADAADTAAFEAEIEASIRLKATAIAAAPAE